MLKRKTHEIKLYARFKLPAVHLAKKMPKVIKAIIQPETGLDSEISDLAC